MSSGARRVHRPNQPGGANWRTSEATPAPAERPVDGRPATPADGQAPNRDRRRPPIVPPPSAPARRPAGPDSAPAAASHPATPTAPATSKASAPVIPPKAPRAPVIPPKAATARRASALAVPAAAVTAAKAKSSGLDSSAARFAERAKAVRRLRHRRIVLALCALLAIAGVGYLIWFSPVLALRASGIDISGTNALASTESVEQVAKKYVGSPMARLDTAAIRTELLDVHGVRDAKVARSWPHGVQIAITPRVPVATVPVDGGFITVDADAVRLEQVKQAPAGIPVMQIPLDTSSRKVMMSVLGVLAEIPTDLSTQIASVQATSVDNVVLTLTDGATVEWGNSSDNALKARVLAVLRKQPAKVYDVSAPTMPVTKN